MPLDKILYFYSDRRQVGVVTENEEYFFYGKLSEVEEKTDSRFVRIHQRYLVNGDRVDHIGRILFLRETFGSGRENRQSFCKDPSAISGKWRPGGSYRSRSGGDLRKRTSHQQRDEGCGCGKTGRMYIERNRVTP